MWGDASTGRIVAAATVALGVLLLWFPAARWVAADAALPDAPDRALARVPLHPRALEIAAARALEAGDDSRAEMLARKAIAQRPLEGRPYRILAAIYERSGRMAEARAAHLAAVSVSPSDAVSRLWIASRLLAESRFPEALSHVDRALRARPDFRQSVFPVLASGLGNPSFVEALVEALAPRPPWRRELLAHLVRAPGDLDVVVPVFEALSTQTSLTTEEQQLLVGAFEGAARWDELQDTWQRLFVSPQEGRGAPFDGGFERDPHGFGLGWRVGRIPGAIVGYAAARGSVDGGRALTVRFMDQRVPFAHVQQRLLLSEGTYRLSGEARADGLRTRRGLRWEVTCDGRSEPLGTSPLIVGSHGWQGWTAGFSVPPGCPSQWLVLRLAAVGPSEQMAGGAVAFDGLRVEPVVTEVRPDGSRLD